ncbi:MAG: putative peptidase [Solirubrobacterales bacterium]|nr:putative peptidase [Solirubrobacterales bacterium]
MELAEYLRAHRERQLEELATFAAFPSVSALDEHRQDLLACAGWLEQHLAGLGLDNVQLLEAGGNPVAYGEWLGAGSDAPTILVYGHYDVQPADPFELWTTPPFTPTVRDGAMFARGISDNKGPIFAALAGIGSTLAAEGRLACNVKVIVEGEEELRSDRLDALIDRRRDLLAADLLVNTDGAFLAPGQPSVPVGLRGMVAIELTLTTAAGDLHSGLFGGVVPNALHALTQLLATLRAPDGRVLVDGFYDGVLPVPEAELAAWAALPLDDADIRAQAGVPALMGGPEPSTLERQWSQPTLDLNGVWGGFQGQGVKTVIPAQGHAKLSCRLVPGQRMDEVLARVITHLERHTRDGAQLRIVSTLEGTPPMVMPADHPAVTAARTALTAGFGREAVLCRLGVSVPVNEIVDRHLGIPAVQLASSSPTDAFHAPDEHFTLASFDAGVRTMAEFLPAYAAAHRG